MDDWAVDTLGVDLAEPPQPPQAGDNQITTTYRIANTASAKTSPLRFCLKGGTVIRNAETLVDPVEAYSSKEFVLRVSYDVETCNALIAEGKFQSQHAEVQYALFSVPDGRLLFQTHDPQTWPFTTFTGPLNRALADLIHLPPPIANRPPLPACNVLLFGVTGAGKSTLINTLLTLVDNGDVVRAPAICGGAAGHVTNEITWILSQKRLLNFEDAFGLSNAATDATFTSCELQMLIDGQLPPRWSRDMTVEQLRSVLHHPEIVRTAAERVVHAVIICVPQGLLFGDANNPQLQATLRHCSAVRAWNYLVVITRADELDGGFTADPSQCIATSPALQQARTRAATLFHVSEARVMFAANYVHTDRRSISYDAVNYRILMELVRRAEENRRYARRVIPVTPATPVPARPALSDAQIKSAEAILLEATRDLHARLQR